MKKLLLLLLCILSFALVSCGSEAKDGKDGKDGINGVGISGIEKISSVEGLDTYKITFTDGSTYEFTIQNYVEPATEGTVGLEYYPFEDGTLGVKIGKALYMKKIVVPETYQGKTVTVILPYGFTDPEEGNMVLEEIVLPNTITKISTSAFNYCESLQKINMPTNLKEIEDEAFKNCSSLTEVIIPEGCEFIGDESFADCESLTNLYIPSTVTEMENGCLMGCESLKTLTLPFVGLTKTEYPFLKHLFGASTPESDYYSFQFPSNLEEITILSSCDSIPEKAFYGLSSLKTINLPNTISSVGDNAFAGCTSLKSIVFTSSEITFDNTPFDSESLTEITYKGVTYKYSESAEFDNYWYYDNNEIKFVTK